MKIKVSDHVCCSWTWGLDYDEEHDEDETGFVLILKKCHPLWEIAREVISHLPGWLPMWVSETAWYERREERHSADVATVAIPENMAKTLYFPIWQMFRNATPDE